MSVGDIDQLPSITDQVKYLTKPTNDIFLRVLQVLRYNLADRKTLQSYKLNYFIEQQVIILIRSDS